MSIVVAALPADRVGAERIVAAMVNASLDVRLCIASPGEDDWRDDVQMVLGARCALFCWTQVSAGDERFQSLATHAACQGIAIGAQFESGAGPSAEAKMSLYPLPTWRRGPRSMVLRLLLGDRLLTDIVMAAKAKASGLDPPPPSSRIHVLRTSAIRLGLGVAAAMATISGVWQLIDYIPWPHPREDAAWARLKTGKPVSCAAVQAFVDEFEDSDHTPQALAALANPEPATRWTERRRKFPLPEPVGLPTPRDDEPLARAAATERLGVAARTLCEGAAGNVDARLKASAVVEPQIACQSLQAGWVCLGPAQATCLMEEPVAEPVCRIAL